MKRIPKTAGFTLLELMVTLSIVGILMTQAVPSLQEIVSNNRMIAELNEFTSAFNLARSEAVKRRATVSLCVRQDSTSCDTSNGTWEDGWLVFVDDNGDGDIDAGDGDVLIRQSDALGGSTTLRSSGNFGADWRIRFDSRGRILGTSANPFAIGSFVLCDERGANHGRALNANGAGYLRIATDDDHDGTVNVNGGSGELTCPALT